jgi:hypothetical protein
VRSPSSAASRFRALLAADEERRLVASCDIDGVVASMMLAAISRWRVGALILSSERVALHPEFASLEDLAQRRETLFGVDVFSTAYPSVSNHPLLWGTRRLGGSVEAGRSTDVYDELIRATAKTRLFLNPSLWVGIGATISHAGNPLASRYRYPLGTSQFLLALLELVDRSPRMFDRQYLPWLVANCDGGLDSIRTYAFNVPMWWSALAAAVGPSSLSEQLFQLASQQRPNDFESVTHRLRSESPEVSERLTDDWNLRTNDVQTAGVVAKWISEISGWPDPFLGGTASLTDWRIVEPVRGVLKLSGLPLGGVEGVRRHLDASVRALHTSFSFFDGDWRLGWLGSVESAPYPATAVAESQ